MNLSIIICVHDTPPRLLSECLDSVMRQRLSDSEVILVDDGSHTDYSAVTASYPVRLHRCEENRGLLAARLVGLGLAVGDYIAFADADDTVSLCYHEPMLYAARKYSADIVINGWAFHSGKSKRCCIRDASMSGKIDARGGDILKLYTRGEGRDHSLFVQWNKLYSRSLLEVTAQELRRRGVHEMGLTYGEDALMNFYNFRSARRAVGINSGFYFYRSHEGQCTAEVEMHRVAAQISAMGTVFDIMLRELAEGSEERRGVLEWRALTARAQYAKARRSGNGELCGLIEERLGAGAHRAPLPRDEEIYLDCELLGDNFDDIDRAMQGLLLHRGDLSACYPRDCRYIRGIIDSYDRLFGRHTSYSKDGGVVIPRRKIRLLHGIVHQRQVARLAARVVKKGSPLRAYLKRKI